MKIYLIITILFLSLGVNSQVFSDSLYLHLYNYHIIKGELKSDLCTTDLEDIYNIEKLIDSIETDCIGIYKFYHLKYDDPTISFLIIDSGSFGIYDILSINTLVENIIDIDCCDEKIRVSWIKEAFKILRHYYEDADMGNLVMQKNYGTYHYFIPLKNLKVNKGILE